MNHVIRLKGIYANLSPDAFQLWAKQYYQCKLDFKGSGHFTPVPYFLLCRSIELELKSRHLVHAERRQIKKDFAHDLVKLYEALPDNQKPLTKEQLYTLSQASEIYKGKGFEYWDPEQALQGYSNFPKLELLESVAKELIGPDIKR